jgi:poly-gamma-glutamate synthesis protein (capsule biosynthesis protein)
MTSMSQRPTTEPRRRRVRARAALLAVAVVGAIGLLGACTPEQYQQWWIEQGNAPLSEPELSQKAAAATVYWNEVARQNRFGYEIRTIDAALAQRMSSSWRPGCPVPLEDLRYVRVTYMRFDGTEQIGELVLHHDVAGYLQGVFKALWDADFRFERMQLVDDFGGDDAASMAANNTSAFNCRNVAGSSRWSEHAYGTAIDINPVQNPYVAGSQVDPPAGSEHLDRANVRPGMMVRGGVGVNVFRFVGWGWGGDWSSAKDYQHVSLRGT